MTNNINIVLTENQIEAIINGEELKCEFDNHVITIRQSYLKDALKPIVRRAIKVVNTDTHSVVSKRSAIDDVYGDRFWERE